MAISHDFVAIDGMDSTSGWNTTGTISSIVIQPNFDEPTQAIFPIISGAGMGTMWKNFSSLNLQDVIVMLSIATALPQALSNINSIAVRLYDSSNRGGAWAEWLFDISDLTMGFRGFKIYTTQPDSDSGGGLGFLTDVDCIELRVSTAGAIAQSHLGFDFLRYGTYVRVTEGSEGSPNTFATIETSVEQILTENYPLRVCRAIGDQVTIRCPIEIGAGSTTWLVDKDKVIVLEIYNSDDPTRFYIQNNSHFVLGEKVS